MKRTLLGIFAVFALALTAVAASPAAAQGQDDSDGDEFVVIDGPAPADTPEEGQPSVDESSAAGAESFDGGAADGIDVAPLVDAADAARAAGNQADFDAAVAELAAVDQAIADAQQHDWDEAQNPTAPAAGGVNVNAVGIFGDPLGCTFTTIQDAVDAASAGDVIIAEPDTYVENINVDKRVNILQSNTAATDCSFNLFAPIPDPANLVIESGSAFDAVVEVGNNGAVDGETVNLSHLTIRGHNSTEGNLFVTDQYEVDLLNVKIANGVNTSTTADIGGGGIRVNEGSTLTTNSVGSATFETSIFANRANKEGGGIHVTDGSTLILEDTSVGSNQADEPGGAPLFRTGGGIYLDDSSGTLINSRVSFNNAEDTGGGISKAGTQTLAINADSLVNSNSSSESSGGGISMVGSLLVVDGGARIINNSAAFSGGGILFGFGSDADLGSNGTAQVEITGNSAGANGGGIWWGPGGTVTGIADNLLLEDNSADGFGGGIYVSNQTFDVREVGCLSSGIASLGTDQYCNEIIDNFAVSGGGGVWVNNGQFDIEQARFDGNTIDTGSGDVGTAIGADNTAVVDVRTTLITGHGANGGSAVVDFDGDSNGTLIAVTFADNGNEQAVDNDSTVTATTSRILTETRFQGGSYSGFCNFAQTGEGVSIPNVTVGDIGFVSTDRSAFEPNSLSNAVDICTTDQGSNLDVFDGSVQDGDDNGTAFWDAGAIEVIYPTLLCNGLSPTIIGTPGADILNGTPGNDVFLSFGGDDTLNGMGGNDTYCAGDGADSIFDLIGGDDWADGGAGNDNIVLGSGKDTALGGLGNDTLNGGADSDDLDGGPGNDSVFGQGGDDFLAGGSGNDTITGLGGQDDIDGGAGVDILNGGPGNDDVFGGSGDDIIFGLTGNDTLDGGANNDLVLGQEGNDEVEGGSGNDNLLGNEGNDTLTDPTGVNTLNGGPGDDDLTGGNGNDQLFGDGDVLQAGDDVLDGGLGSDQIIGFAGADEIIANDGIADTVNGGPGVDACFFDGGLDTVFNCP